MKDIAIYGAGGFGREMASLLKRINSIEKQWNFVGKSFSEDTEENDNFFRVSNLDKEYFKGFPLWASFLLGFVVPTLYLVLSSL